MKNLLSLPTCLVLLASVTGFVACGPTGESSSESGGSGAPADTGTLDLGVPGGGIGSVDDNPLAALSAPPDCGDGVLNDDEACDDGGVVGGDGCLANCRAIEEGFICPTAGQPCNAFAVCGDGFTRFPEQCDDGNLAAGDGCSDNCKVSHRRGSLFGNDMW